MPETNPDIVQLQAAIAAFEAQRPILGDEMVDAALGPMREKLAALQAQAAPEQQRKLATVLFADVSGFTALSETLDAEVVAGVMNDLWLVVDRAITDQGGHIDKHIGDAVMALWGVDGAREDDPEMAVRGGAGDAGCRGDLLPDPSDAVVTADWRQHRAGAAGQHGHDRRGNGHGRRGRTWPAGWNMPRRWTGCSSPTTPTATCGAFLTCGQQEPLTVKGKVEPVQTYVVERAKPRAFRPQRAAWRGRDAHDRS